jgi:hypothetical protein
MIITMDTIHWTIRGGFQTGHFWGGFSPHPLRVSSSWTRLIYPQAPSSHSIIRLFLFTPSLTQHKTSPGPVTLCTPGTWLSIPMHRTRNTFLKPVFSTINVYCDLHKGKVEAATDGSDKKCRCLKSVATCFMRPLLAASLISFQHKLT